MKTYESILNMHSCVGNYEGLKALILKAVGETDVEVRDIDGDLVVEKKGKGTKIMIVCNANTTECLLTEIKENRAGVMFMGEVNPAAWMGAKLRSENGCYGILRTKKKETIEIKEEDLYLDFGISCEENGITANSFAHLCDSTVIQEGIVFGSDLLAKAGMMTMLAALKKCACQELSFCFVFLSRPQLGTFASECIAAEYRPDTLITVFGYPVDERFCVGKGPGILLKDGNAVVGDQMRKKMLNIAEEEKIPYQIFIGKRNIQNEKISVSGNGTRLGGICIPVEGSDEPIGKISMEDIEKSTNLLLKVLLAL